MKDKDKQQEHYIVVVRKTEIFASHHKEVSERLAKKRGGRIEVCNCDSYWNHFGRQQDYVSVEDHSVRQYNNSTPTISRKLPSRRLMGR